MLTAQGVVGAGYVASERVEGALEGRQGTVVIQHGRMAEGSDQSSDGNIVPASGTGGLTGTSGDAKELQLAVLTLVYTL